MRSEASIRQLLTEIDGMAAEGPSDPVTRAQIAEVLLLWVLDEASREQVEHAITSGRAGESWSSSAINLLWAKRKVQEIAEQLGNARDDLDHLRHQPPPTAQ